jgi:hypothetical protein
MAGGDRQPRWLTELERHGADPLAIYDHTYGAIASSEGLRRRRRRFGTVLLLLLAVALAALAVHPETMLWLRHVHLPPLHIAEPRPQPVPTPRAAYAPEVIGTTPARPKADIRIGDEQEFAIAAVGPDVRYSWTVDGNPAGTGPRWNYAPMADEVGLRRVEVVVTGREGSERRAWAVRVRPPHAPPLRRPATPPPVQMASAPAVRAPAPAPPPRAAPPAPPPRAAPPPATGEVVLARPDSADMDVRRWLERYADAWRAHDVEALRRMGQVTTDREEDALREYFERVHDLDVEVNVIALDTNGDRTTVRFTRRDRFRDPAGRLVLKESPMLVKQVVRTPMGLRFLRPTG